MPVATMCSIKSAVLGLNDSLKHTVSSFKFLRRVTAVRVDHDLHATVQGSDLSFRMDCTKYRKA